MYAPVQELAPEEIKSLMHTWHQSLKDKAAQVSTPSAAVAQATPGLTTDTAKLQYTLMKRKRSAEDVIDEGGQEDTSTIAIQNLAQQVLSVGTGHATIAAPDAFQSVLRVVDVHAHDPNEQGPSHKRQKATISQLSDTAAAKPAPTAPEPSAVDYDALLRAHFMPMVRR